ncbi:MAG: hypothetical protein ACREFP_20820 [Acetobacteraceae bacterium]
MLDVVGMMGLRSRENLTRVIHRPDGKRDQATPRSRVDRIDEAASYRHDGTLQYALRGVANAA